MKVGWSLVFGFMVALVIAAPGCRPVCPCGEKVKPATYSGPVIDAHAHLLFGDEEKALNVDVPASPAELIRRMDAAGIAQAVVMCIAPAGDPAGTAEHNDRIVEAARLHPRLIPMGSVHPADGAAAISELDRLAKQEVRALKLHPNTQGFDVSDPAVLTVVREAGLRNMIVLFDGYSPFDANQPGKLIKLAMEAPGTRIVIAHVGGPRFVELATLIHVLRSYAWYRNNLWVDLSFTAEQFGASPLGPTLAWAIGQVGADRVLFGSDFPIGDPDKALRAVRALGLDASTLRAVLHDNARDLFLAGRTAPSPH
ncbi:MAG: metal-dependent hydrolase [Deltaproteobacteria bacterium HGW-Deltaproteobacteria-22]|jgi:hypothetical protein|nr:MAG: metal-dependent hydrolase [Deltaproteobacteria bacterium HGW-Deltaproteobacteria-22]